MLQWSPGYIKRKQFDVPGWIQNPHLVLSLHLHECMGKQSGENRIFGLHDQCIYPVTGNVKQSQPKITVERTNSNEYMYAVCWIQQGGENGFGFGRTQINNVDTYHRGAHGVSSSRNG